MMRQMREATKPIMLLAALAFVALMVFEWGMDASGRSGGGLGEIGSVNGEPVMYEQYMAAYRQIYDQVQRSQEDLISSQQNKEIEDAAFDEVVNQLLIRQELRSRDISVSDQEISDAAQSTPPDYLRPEFVNEAGAFDLPSYQAWLASLPQEQLILIEAYFRDVIPRGKLFRQISSGIYLPDGALWQEYADQNERVEIRYIPMDPGTRYPAEDFTVTSEEIEAYYDENQDEFEIPARATVHAVVLDKTPTPADTAAIEQLAADLRQEILDGADFGDIAIAESDDAVTAPNGGDLGVFARADMTPIFDTAVFEAPVGEVVGPIKTPFGYHVLEVQERWAADSARARHILLEIRRTDDSEIELLTLADSLEDLSEGMSLQEAATSLGLTASTLEISQTFPFLVGAGQISEGSDWAFEEASPGDVSPVFETPTAFYAIELVSAEPEGVLPLADAAPSIESTLVFQKQMDRGKADAEAISERIRGGEALANVAADVGIEVRTAGPFSRNDFVPGIGRHNAAIGAAFGLDVGEVSEPVSTASNTFIIEQLQHFPADSTEWRAQLLAQRQVAVVSLQQQRLQQWIAALRAAADIVDRRDIVLVPQDEQDIPQMPVMF